MDERFNVLQGARFSSIDLASSYHPVALEDKDWHTTAFTIPFGLYKILNMPMGVCKGPATFQRLMQMTISELKLNKRG